MAACIRLGRDLLPGGWAASPERVDLYTRPGGSLPPGGWTSFPVRVDGFPRAGGPIPPGGWTYSPGWVDLFTQTGGPLPLSGWTASPVRVGLFIRAGGPLHPGGWTASPGRVGLFPRAGEPLPPNGWTASPGRVDRISRVGRNRNPAVGRNVEGNVAPTLKPMKASIKLDLKSLTPLRLLALLRHVARSLDGNPDFPAPPVPTATMLAMARAFETQIAEATAGSRHSKVLRNTKDTEVRAALRQVADYVRMIAQGNESMLCSSGFELAKVPGAPQRMDAPRLRATDFSGRHGEVLLNWSGVVNRRTYQIYMTDKLPSQPDPQWTLVGITGKITHRITGLEPYKAYWFCVSAVGALGEGMKSNATIGRAA